MCYYMILHRFVHILWTSLQIQISNSEHAVASAHLRGTGPGICGKERIVVELPFFLHSAPIRIKTSLVERQLVDHLPVIFDQILHEKFRDHDLVYVGALQWRGGNSMHDVRLHFFPWSWLAPFRCHIE